ncbi:hypothetical protein PENSUB_11506 [Penicillium subrubescens]|uniref:Uncharacterized protein n=1 Tax=Penicillium subrubescens TaxID=1316194 RepID=A0A1Q5UQJ5_9EURO|nr:hypothetical protein PENSUB_11506 [Penicillium subrubescens]
MADSNGRQRTTVPFRTAEHFVNLPWQVMSGRYRTTVYTDLHFQPCHGWSIKPDTRPSDTVAFQGLLRPTLPDWPSAQDCPGIDFIATPTSTSRPFASLS